MCELCVIIAVGTLTDDDVTVTQEDAALVEGEQIESGIKHDSARCL